MRPKIPITSFKNYSCVFFFDFKHVFETCIYNHLLTKYKASYSRVNRADLRINFFFFFFFFAIYEIVDVFISTIFAYNEDNFATCCDRKVNHKI